MRGKPELLFLHGKESTPTGRKYQALSEHFEVDNPDFQGMDIWQRLTYLHTYTAGRSDLVMVGSSYGGLLAALMYAKAPERFRGYLLMAPAFYSEHEDAMLAISRVPDIARVIHGTHDETVPVEEARAFCEKVGLEFVEVDGDHRLAEYASLMVESVRELFWPDA